MTKTCWTGTFSLVVAFCFSPFLRAEDAKPSEPRAVLIGIGQYADKQIKPRPHAEDDVKALYDLFTDKQYLGIKPENVRLLLGKADEKRKSQPATRANILDAAKWLASEAKASDLTLFVFVGEGGPLGEKSDRRCYFATDSSFKDRATTAVSAAELEDRLKKLKSQKFVALVDIDFRGFDDKKVQATTLGNGAYREFLGDDGTEAHNPQPGRTIFLATNGLSTSIDLKEHGLFAHVVLDAFKGTADKQGYEPDGVVTVDELATHVAKELPELAQKHGKTKEEKEQTHFILGERHSETPITTNPAVIGKARELLDKFNKLAKDKELPEKIAEEGRTLLGQMPKIKPQQELRKQYQKLAEGTLTVEKFNEKRDELLIASKLDKEDADKYAEGVLEAADKLVKEYVKDLNRGDLIGSAIKGLYRRVNEKLPEALTGRLDKVKTMDVDDLRKLLVDARVALGKREDLANNKDIDFSLQRMFGTLDPFSTYIDPQTVEQFKKRTEGSFVGIGVQIREDRASGFLYVSTPLKGSPAYKAGVRAADLITAVTIYHDEKGKELDKPDTFSTKNMRVGDAVKKIMGKEGTKLKIAVQREGEAKPLEFEIVRGRIQTETVLGHKRKANDDWDWIVDPVNKIGYVRISEFARPTARDLAKAVAEMKKAGMRGLVLDLRFNPGGLLDVANDVTDLFIDDGLIVSVKNRKGEERPFYGFSEDSELGFPMACLINGDSASGSEIVSAALQDHKRAIVMGERSFGKGSVQNVVDLEGGGEIKLTTASFWRPSGKNLNKASTKGEDKDEWGVRPDKGFELLLARAESDDLEDHMRESEVIYPGGKAPKEANPKFKDRQLDMALEYLRGQIKIADKFSEAKKTE